MIDFNFLEKKKILVLGFGKEGISTFVFFRKKFPEKIIGLADKLALEDLEPAVRKVIEADPNLEIHFGGDYLKCLGAYDVIFKSSGIKSSLPELVSAKRNGAVLSSNTEMFFDLCKGMVIGVTGTKGKSTAASMIYEVLKAGGVKVCFGGNIGVPLLSLLNHNSDNEVYTVELSSFQLSGLEKSPQIAVIQGIAREHLDYHADFKEYVRAKGNIARHQKNGDKVIFNAANRFAKEIAEESRGEKIPFAMDDIEGAACFVDKDNIVFRSNGICEKIISIHDIPLFGGFNIQNVIPSVVIGKVFNLSVSAIVEAIKIFKPLEHRLEMVEEVEGVLFYNDSLATVPEAAIAALNSFAGRRVVLIAGGFDRGQDFSELGKLIVFSLSKVVGLVLFPTTAERILKSVLLQAKKESVKPPPHFFVDSMREAVTRAYDLARSGDVVLLSPASASFGLFDNYADRGDRFKSEVRRLMEAENDN